MNGTNLQDAFEAAMTAAAIRGQIALGVFERRPVVFWTPPSPVTA